MRNVVLDDTSREHEFRPDLMFRKYLDLLEKDAKKEFGRAKKLFPCDCPACRGKNKKKVFKKFGFQYNECSSCGSVYMSPHPKDIDIKKHYLESSSIRFWRDKLSRTTKNKRSEKIYQPRIQWIVSMMEEYLPSAKNLADFNSKETSYIEELLRSKYFHNKVIVNPYFEVEEIPGLAGPGQKGFIFLPDLDSVKTKSQTMDIATAFEVLDLTSDADSLLKTVKNILVRGGLFFLTTISISGFDLQVLWENSQSILPPDRINLFSKNGLKALFKRHGFEMLEYSTPGLLDIDIVKNAVKNSPDLDISRFVKNIILTDDNQLFHDFQEFLQINRLSSFVRILLRKK